jgi:hypothetical protein
MFPVLESRRELRPSRGSKPEIPRIAKAPSDIAGGRIVSAPAECMTVPCRDALPSLDDGSKFGVSAGLDK